MTTMLISFGSALTMSSLLRRLSHRLKLSFFVAPLSYLLCLVVVTDLEHARTTTKEPFFDAIHHLREQHSPALTVEQLKIRDERRNRLQSRENLTRPSLSELIDHKGNVIAGSGVDQLLDFSIVGFPKCGTSSMMEWLHQHSDVACIQDEVWGMVWGRPRQLVKRLYKGLPEGPYVRGYKCPAELTSWHVMNYYREYFPSARMIVGIRHPISWFQSLYNFRIQNLDYVPHPNKLIGVCSAGRKNTCTEKGNFALDLMRLGKTNLFNGAYIPQPSTPLQEEILGHYRRMWYNISEARPVANELFLFDMAQLGDRNATRTLQFRLDMADFLQLTSILPPMVHNRPGIRYENETVQQLKDTKKIRICDDEFQPVRDELMRIARLNSEWIRSVFLRLPSVHVSSPDYLDFLLQGWNHDPCNSSDPMAAKVRAAVKI